MTDPTHRITREIVDRFVEAGVDPLDALEALLTITAAQMVVLRRDTAAEADRDPVAATHLRRVITRYINALIVIRDTPVAALDQSWQTVRVQ